MRAKYKLILICYVLSVSCSPIRNLYVKFGEFAVNKEQEDDGVLRVYFDRLGILYPGIIIPDSLLLGYESNLDSLYKKRSEYLGMAGKKHLGRDAKNTEELQQKLIQEVASAINTASKSSQVVILIHGFNKHHSLPSDGNSFQEYKVLRNKIDSLFPRTRLTYVEVYWDGLSQAASPKFKKILNTRNIWDNAQAGSNNVGLELRRILSKIKSDSTIVVTHSTGASVITTALFNADKFNLYNNLNPFKYGVIKRYQDSVNYKTPVRKFRVGMIAPAIPGENTFNDYSKRVPCINTVPDNYFFLIGFNKRDYATSKLFLARFFGATTLASNKRELTTVKGMLNRDGRLVIDSVDFTKKTGGGVQFNHTLRAYVANEMPMDRFLKNLFHKKVKREALQQGVD